MVKVKCSICTLNPEGLKWQGCPHKGHGCQDCREKCQNPAIYIGGMNVCSEHIQALYNRLENIFPIQIDNVFVKTPGGWHKKLANEEWKRNAALGAARQKANIK